MSHFTVAVITDGTKTIEKLLAPYQENNMGDCPKEYLEFSSVQEEYLKKYEEKKEEIKSKYPTFKAYMEDYCGYKLDEEKREYGYWENPNKKWDWWTIGGRWSGLIKLKEGAIGIKNKPIFYKDNFVECSGFVDSASIKDIDFEQMKKHNIQRCEKQWEDAHKENEVIKHLMYGIGKEDTKETYVRRKSEFTTYAVITPDGKWHSKGDMGWWGLSSETQEEAGKWDKSFYEAFIQDANPEHVITIVDCHI